MKTLKYEVDNKIGTLWLSRPQVRNAFNEEMIAEMTQFFRGPASDPELRALCLRGEGEGFCAGGDLNWMKSMVDFSEQENRADSEQLYDMYEALQSVPVPVVTLVHGHAMGGALGLIAASDVVFAVDGTQFCFSEVRLGLAPAVISAFVKDKILPRDMARYFLTAEVFDTKEAHSMGLIHGYGSATAMQDQVTKTLRKIGNNGPHAVRATKTLISELRSTRDPKALTTKVIAQLRVSPEGQEGLQAFFDKRKPNWMES
jgi:methylglutaconyl-CoA hydratase